MSATSDPVPRSRNRFSLVLDMGIPSTQPRGREQTKLTNDRRSLSHRALLSLSSSPLHTRHASVSTPKPLSSSPASAPQERRWSGIFTGGDHESIKRRVSEEMVSPTQRLRSILSPRPSLRRAAITTPRSSSFPKSPTSTAPPPMAFSPFEMATPPTPGSMAALDEVASISTSGAVSTVATDRSTDPLIATTQTAPQSPSSAMSVVSNAPPSLAEIPIVSSFALDDGPSSAADDGLSIISSLPPLPDPVVLQRARHAKLARILGEDVPAPTVGQTQPSPPASASLSAGSTSPAPRPRRLRRPMSRRRLSLDMSMLLPRIPSSGAPSTSPDKEPPTMQPAKTLKRSRSLWARRALGNVTNMASAGVDAGPSQTDLLNPSRGQPFTETRPSSPLPPLTERQRIANVRRARKMTELFGLEPPPALFQITAPAPLTHRASFATFATTTDAASFLTPLSERRASLLTVSDSGASVLTVSDGKRTSVLTVLSVSSSVGEARPKLRRHSSVDTHITTTELVVAPTPSVSHTPTLMSIVANSGMISGPPSPPPFTTRIGRPPTPSQPLLPSSSGSTPHPSRPSTPRQRTDSNAPSSAWRRRRQAAKLAHFFGVESREIEPAFNEGHHYEGHSDIRGASMDVLPASILRMRSPSPSAIPTSPTSFCAGTEGCVDVRVRAPTRLWGVRETDDMQAAISRLRELRAS